MDVLIVVICSILAALLLAAVVSKAVLLVKRVRRERAGIEEPAVQEKYVLDIVQDGATVRIECDEVNSEGVELVAEEEEE